MTYATDTHNEFAQFCATTTANRVPLIGRIAHMLRTRQQRLALARLDDAHLRDIGVTYKQANAESRRPFWDAPSNWRN